MNSQTNHYIKIRYTMTTQSNIKQFENRLNSSPIKNNGYYLGLLLVNIVNIPAPKIEYIRTLIKFGADINFIVHDSDSQRVESSRSILMTACQNSVAANVKYLLSFQNLEVGYKDKMGKNALDYALRNPSQNESVQIIDIISKQFPHLISQNIIGQKSLLYRAIEMGKTKIIEYLIKNYVDPNEQLQPERNTPLHYAIRLSGQISSKIIEDSVYTLLKCKANPRIKNFQNQDCFSYAQTYLFDLQAFINGRQFTNQFDLQVKNYKCLTTNTYADSRTAVSKDDQFPQSQAGYKNQQLLNQQQLYDIQLDLLNANTTQNDNQIQAIQNQNEQQQQVQNQISKQEFYIQFHQNLAKQIQTLSQNYYKQYEAALKDIHNLMKFLNTIGRQLQLSVQIIGSFATGLWTHHSDIDIVFINEKANFVNIEVLLNKIHNKLMISKKKLKINEHYFNSNLKFPNIKLKLTEQLHQRKIQIAIFQRKCSGKKYVSFINQYLTNYPIIRPVFFSVHKILQTFNLHKPTQQGFKTYTIFLMILYAYQWAPCFSFSQLFVNFINYYKYFHQYPYYRDTNNQIRLSFDLMDPLNTINNTGGRQTNTQKFLQMLQAIQCTYKLAENQKDPEYFLEKITQIHQMFP